MYLYPFDTFQFLQGRDVEKIEKMELQINS